MEDFQIPEDQLAAIGSRFHRYFRRKGYTAKEIADRVGVHQNQLTSMVNGNDFHLRNLVKALRLFPALRLDWLLLGEGEAEEKGASTFEIRNALEGYAFQLKGILNSPVPQLDKQAQSQARHLKELLDLGIFIRCGLLAQLADIQAQIIETNEY